MYMPPTLPPVGVARPGRDSILRREPGRLRGVQFSAQIVVNRTAHENEPSDAELVRQAQRGVPAAFAELVARYQDRVFNTCYRMCHNHADALDLTQTTFLKALEGLRRFQGRSAFYTWLFRIAINLTISHRRARQHPVCSLDGAGGDCDPPRAQPSARDTDASGPVEREERQRRVAWALAQLDDEFRAAVVLKDIEDLNYATIAEILDVPVGTVKSRIFRGRLLLRNLLRDERTAVGRA
jgi:RNA polymerase sigma-70 factor (ECF subfamily)